MNLVVLKGRLARDINLHFSNQGTAYTNFTVAVNRYSKDNKSTDFINCTAFGKTAELIAERFSKGQEILIEGNLKIDVFEKEEKKQYKTSVMIERVEFCGSKKDKDEDDDGRDIYDADVFPY